MKEFDAMPPCCVNAVMPECDSCKGFDKYCVAYRAALKVVDIEEYQFRINYAKELAEAKTMG